VLRNHFRLHVTKATILLITIGGDMNRFVDYIKTVMINPNAVAVDGNTVYLFTGNSELVAFIFE
jgi:hypothetical protein